MKPIKPIKSCYTYVLQKTNSLQYFIIAVAIDIIAQL